MSEEIMFIFAGGGDVGEVHRPLPFKSIYCYKNMNLEKIVFKQRGF
jgi:hypothetical protein